MGDEDVKIAGFFILGAVVVICSLIFGGVQCNAKDAEVFKACVEAGHKPAECSALRGAR